MGPRGILIGGIELFPLVEAAHYELETKQRIGVAFNSMSSLMINVGIGFHEEVGQQFADRFIVREQNCFRLIDIEYDEYKVEDLYTTQVNVNAAVTRILRLLLVSPSTFPHVILAPRPLNS